MSSDRIPSSPRDAAHTRRIFPQFARCECIQAGNAAVDAASHAPAPRSPTYERLAASQRGGRRTPRRRRASARTGLCLALACAAALLAWACAAPSEDAPPPAAGAPDAPSSLNEAPPDVDGRLAAGIIGSKHDFTQSGLHARDLCTPCHTPHLPEARPPLLDARPVAAAAIRPFQAIAVDLDDASLLCLSCHDGVIATDVYTAAHATRLSSQLGSSQFGSGPLTGHPVGVVYPAADPKYRSPQAIAAQGRIPLPDGRVQCISCHDPHNSGRHEGMLVMSNSGSRLCLSCHRL